MTIGPWPWRAAMLLAALLALSIPVAAAQTPLEVIESWAAVPATGQPTSGSPTDLAVRLVDNGPPWGTLAAALITGGLAFLGFWVGTNRSHKLEIRRIALMEQREAKAVRAALRAEVLNIGVVANARASGVPKMVQLVDAKITSSGEASTPVDVGDLHFPAFPTQVFETLVRGLGVLADEEWFHVINFYGLLTFPTFKHASASEQREALRQHQRRQLQIGLTAPALAKVIQRKASPETLAALRAIKESKPAVSDIPPRT